MNTLPEEGPDTQGRKILHDDTPLKSGWPRGQAPAQKRHSLQRARIHAGSIPVRYAETTDCIGASALAARRDRW